MATQNISLTGKAMYAMVYDGQIDRAFVDEDSTKGGNWGIKLELDDAEFKKYNALGLSMVRPKGQTVSLKRYEFKPTAQGIEPLGPPIVTLPEGVPAGSSIGNGSVVTVNLEVYDYEFKKRPGRAARLVSVKVLEHVPYEKKPVSGEEAVPF